MQVDSGAATMPAGPWDAEMEALEDAAAGQAKLPVHIPDPGGAPPRDAIDAARPEEVRGLLAAIRRLESVVEEETLALEAGKKIDFDDFSTRKSRSMLEFVRLMRTRIHLGAEAEVTEEIQRLRQKLDRNRTILEMHYAAVREVATIILRAIRDAESDGTYSANAAQDGK